MQYFDYRVWYEHNIAECRYRFGCQVKYDTRAYLWIMITMMPLPEIYINKHTALLITTPGQNLGNPDLFKFYIDKGIRKKLGGKIPANLFEEDGNNPFAKHGFGYLCHHVQSFDPKFPIEDGDTIYLLCKTLCLAMATK